MRSYLRLALVLLLTLFAAQAYAESEDTQLVGYDSAGLCGLYRVGSPTCARGFALSGTTGYGITRLHGTHQRVLGDAALSYTPLDWLSLSLQLAGRIDAHPEGNKTTLTATGDPWLRARAGKELSRGLSLGGELGLWLPGNDAPSFKPSATTVEARALGGYRKAKLTLLGTLGFRLDNSGNSAPDLRRLKEGDRISLGLSDSHAVLLGIGASYVIKPKLAAFAELSGDVLIGKKAPSFTSSPLRVAVGARYWLMEQLQGELSLVGSLSQRPSVARDAPLVPIEPRFALMAGLRYAFGRPQRARTEDLTSTPEPEAQEIAGAPQLATLTGVLTDDAGAPLPDVAVELTQGDAEPLTAISDAEGRFVFENVPQGKAQLNARTPGFEPASWEVDVVGERLALPAQAMVASTDQGTLRCLVRSFRSEPLKARIVVRTPGGKRAGGGTTNAQGILEIPLTAGQYRVMIEVAGYKSQRTNVQIAPNDVAILNVDMREGK